MIITNVFTSMLVYAQRILLNRKGYSFSHCPTPDNVWVVSLLDSSPDMHDFADVFSSIWSRHGGLDRVWWMFSNGREEEVSLDVVICSWEVTNGGRR